MDEENSIKGQQGAIVDDPIPFGNFDYGFWLDLEAYGENESDVLGGQCKEEAATFEIKNSSVFIQEHSYFSGYFKKSNFNEEIMNNGPQQQLPNIQAIQEHKHLELSEQNQDKAEHTSNKKVDRRKTKHLNKPKLLNQTKNIPKNYAKEIIKFIRTNRRIIKPVLEAENITYEELIENLEPFKEKYNKISDLRYMWINHKYAKVNRILTQHFLRKYCFKWIFNSKIQKYNHPLKYRRRMMEGARNPTEFYYLKEYA